MTRRASLVFRLRNSLRIGLHFGLVVAANLTALALRFDGEPPRWAVAAVVNMLPWLVVVRGVTFVPFRLYQGVWRYTGIYDLKAIVEAVVASSILFAAIAASPLGPAVYPRSIFVMDALLLMVGLAGVRLAPRVYRDLCTPPHGKRLLIVGAGDAGEMIVRDIRAREDYAYQPIGFIDDDPRKLRHRIHGVPVLGSRRDLPQIMTTHRPDEVLIAIPSADPTLIRAVVRALEPTAVPIKTLPRLRDLIVGTVGLGQIRTLNFEDLLAREPVGLDPAPLQRLIAGRRVLVTGAGGSIGAELCRQIATMGAATLVMLDRYENGLHAVHGELRDRAGATALHTVVGDVTDEHRVDAIFGLYRPQIVFHAAAHKHVVLMEESPSEAIKNNVTGTRTVADAADRHNVDRFVLISTDKAVNATSVMGASKRLAEFVVREYGAASRTTFAVVRFGNVLGSNGSVVPTFLGQIRRGGPVTVTHPEVRRFFMLIPEAVQLVLHAAAQADRGAIYVLDMGEQVKVLDMARHMIRLAGHVPEKEIPIEFVGLRPGEKLSEELVGEGESVRPSGIDKILCVTDSAFPPARASEQIHAIERAAAANDGQALAAILRQLVPTCMQSVSLPAAAATPLAVRNPVGSTVGAVERSGAADVLCVACRSGRLRRWDVRAAVDEVQSAIEQRWMLVCESCGWRGCLVAAEPVAAGHDDAFGAADVRGARSAPAMLPFCASRPSLPRDLN